MVLDVAQRIAVAAASAISIVTAAAVAFSDKDRPVTYFIAEGDGDTGYLPSDVELAVWALEAWERSAGGAFRLQPAREREALVRLYWAPPKFGNYGETRPLLVGGRRGAAVFVRPDAEALGREIADRARSDVLWRDSIVYLTCLHELGHALGLAHTRDERDIMYFFGYGGDIIEYFARYRRQLTSRSDIRSRSGLSEADVQRVKALSQPR